PLAHDDAAREHGLAAELLDAETFRIRITTVLGRGLAFFVRHDSLLERDAGDPDSRELAPVAAAATVFAPPLELEDLHLVAAQVADDLDGDLGALHGRLADGDLVAVAEQQDLAELHLGSGLALHQGHLEHLIGRDAGLDAADVHDRIHGTLTPGATGRVP